MSRRYMINGSGKYIISRKVSQSVDAQKLTHFLADRKTVCITGAGISTASGIPDYRGVNGSYKRGHKPMVHAEFMSSEHSRKRYWARSMAGFKHFSAAIPNTAHYALATFEDKGYIFHTISQNVDGLHQKAGSRNILNLHGRIDSVRCTSCNAITSRDKYQRVLEHHNESFLRDVMQLANSHTSEDLLRIRADGDMHLGDLDLTNFQIPPCPCCGQGMLKPDVVFFGSNVPKADSDEAMAHVMASEGVLVVGSSLEVYSAYRLVRHATRGGIPLAIVNTGITRPEREGMQGIVFKSEMNCCDILEEAVQLLCKK